MQLVYYFNIIQNNINIKTTPKISLPGNQSHTLLKLIKNE